MYQYNIKYIDFGLNVGEAYNPSSPNINTVGMPYALRHGRINQHIYMLETRVGGGLVPSPDDPSAILISLN